MLIIKEIEWENMFGTRKTHLNFENTASPVYVVHYINKCPLKGAVMSAIQMICSSKYMTMESLKPIFHNNNYKKGSFVRLLMVVQTADEKKSTKSTELNKLEVWRFIADDPKYVVYSLNGNKNKIKCNLTTFQGRFQLNMDYLLAQHGMEAAGHGGLSAGDLLNVKWQQIMASIIKNDTDVDVNGNVANIVLSQIVKFLTNISNEMQVNNSVNTEKSIKNMSKNYITVKKQLTDIDFSHIQTCIQPYKDRKFVILTYENSIDGVATSPLYEIWLIAFQFALASNVQQRFIYISNLNKLQKAVCMDMVSTVHKNNIQNKSVNLVKNYVQRIANCANRLGIITIIDYPGCLLMPVQNANIIFCYQKTTSSSSPSSSWVTEVEK